MVKVFQNTEALSLAAAEIFVKTARAAVQESGRFSVALTGGSSPAGLYRLLAQQPYRSEVPWRETYVFWGDERWVPLTDERSNSKMAFDLFLNQVPVPKSQIFPMWGPGQPEDFARKYEEVLRNHFGAGPPAFSLVLAGMGDDGHTASLFPGTAVLQEKEHWVSAYYLEPQQMYRITLTAPCLNQAKKTLFLTFGEKKAQALSQVLEGSFNPVLYPAQLIQPENGEVIWFVDEAAAQKLTKK